MNKTLISAAIAGLTLAADNKFYGFGHLFPKNGHHHNHPVVNVTAPVDPTVNVTTPVVPETPIIHISFNQDTFNNNTTSTNTTITVNNGNPEFSHLYDLAEEIAKRFQGVITTEETDKTDDASEEAEEADNQLFKNPFHRRHSGKPVDVNVTAPVVNVTTPVVPETPIIHIVVNQDTINNVTTVNTTVTVNNGTQGASTFFETAEQIAKNLTRIITGGAEETDETDDATEEADNQLFKNPFHKSHTGKPVNTDVNVTTPVDPAVNVTAPVVPETPIIHVVVTQETSNNVTTIDTTVTVNNGTQGASTFFETAEQIAKNLTRFITGGAEETDKTDDATEEADNQLFKNPFHKSHSGKPVHTDVNVTAPVVNVTTPVVPETPIIHVVVTQETSNNVTTVNTTVTVNNGTQGASTFFQTAEELAKNLTRIITGGAEETDETDDATEDDKIFLGF